MRLISIALRGACLRAGAATQRRVPSASQPAELWTDPGPAPRGLFAGPGGNSAVRPPTDARFTVVKRDTGSFSISYRVRDEREKITEGLELR